LILKPMTYGESLFFERMQNKNVGNWAGLGKIQKLIGVLDRLGLMSLVTWFLYSTKTFTPLVLIAKKK